MLYDLFAPAVVPRLGQERAEQDRSETHTTDWERISPSPASYV